MYNIVGFYTKCIGKLLENWTKCPNFILGFLIKIGEMKHSKITQRGDSITLNINRPSNFTFDKDRFKVSGHIDTNTGEFVHSHSPLKQQYLSDQYGVKTISIQDETIELGFSAKILGHNYKEGITLDTISTALDKINELGGMNISVDGILRDSVMRTFDNTYNIDLDNKGCVDEYINSLSFGCVGNVKLNAKGYTDESIILQLDTKVKNRMIFYNKEKELLSNSKKFLEHHKGIQIVDDFKDVLRVELNITSQDKMRQNFKLGNGKVRLIDILQSKNNAISQNFARFVDKKLSEKFLFNYDEMLDMEVANAQQLERRFFIEQNLKIYQGNAQRVIDIYKKFYKDGQIPSRVKKDIKLIEKEYQTKQLMKVKSRTIGRTQKFQEIVEKINNLK